MRCIQFFMIMRYFISALGHLIAVLGLLFCLVYDFFNYISSKSIYRIKPNFRYGSIHFFFHINCLEPYISDHIKIISRYKPLIDRDKQIAFLILKIKYDSLYFLWRKRFHSAGYSRRGQVIYFR